MFTPKISVYMELLLVGLVDPRRGVAILAGICSIAAAAAAAAGFVVRPVDMGTKKAVPLGIVKAVLRESIVTAESLSSVKLTRLPIPLELATADVLEVFFFLQPLSFSSMSISAPPLLSLPSAGEYMIL